MLSSNVPQSSRLSFSFCRATRTSPSLPYPVSFASR